MSWYWSISELSPGPLFFSIYIHSLGDVIPCHCFRYHWHTNSSFFLPPWTPSLNLRVAGYLVSLLGSLRLNHFQNQFPSFPIQSALMADSPISFPCSTIFPVAHNNGSKENLLFPLILHTQLDKSALDPPSVCHPHGYQPGTNLHLLSLTLLVVFLCIFPISLASTWWPAWSW